MPIMLDVKDKVNANLLVAIWSRSVFPKVLECFIRINLVQFKSCCILPFCVIGLLVELHGMVVIAIAWELVTVLLARCGAVGSKLGLVDMTEKLLLVLRQLLELLPAGLIEEVVVISILG